MSKDLVVPDSKNEAKGISRHGISATDLAHTRFGRKIIANMVILGFMNTLLEIVSIESLAKAIEKNVPAGTEELNLNAMKEGIKLANEELKAVK